MLQIALSFGHLHLDDLGLTPPPATVHGQLASGQTPAPDGPADPNHYPAPDDYCAICASIALVATAIPSLPPALIVPVPVRYVWPSPAPVRDRGAKLTLSFQARGPPSA